MHVCTYNRHIYVYLYILKSNTHSLGSTGGKKRKKEKKEVMEQKKVKTMVADAIKIWNYFCTNNK